MTNVLDLPMQENDAEASTIREYLGKLLLTVWIEGEQFSGKRPFGNSGWEFDLYIPLVKAGLVWGEIDEDGYVETVDHGAGDLIIGDAIRELTGLPAREGE